MSTHTESNEVRVPKWQVGSFYLFSTITFLLHPMFSYALVIYTQSLTGSEAITGTVYLVTFLPFALFAMMGGIYADRYPRQRIVVIGCIVVGLSIGAIAWGIHYNLFSGRWFYALLVLGALYGIAIPFVVTARLAMVANLLPDKKVGSGTIFMTLIGVIGFGLAPLVVGTIKSSFDYTIVFSTIAGLWVLSGIGYLANFTLRPQQYSAPVSLKEGFVQGVSFIIQHRLLSNIFILMSVGTIFVIGTYHAVMPEFLREVYALDEQQRGSTLAIFGFGLLVGGMLALVVRKLPHSGLILLSISVLLGVVFGSIAFANNYHLVLLMLGTAGVLGGIWNGMIFAIVQEESPDYVKGRVISVSAMILNGAPALGGFIFSLVSAAYSVTIGIMAAGLSAALISLVMCALLRGVRDYNRPGVVAISTQNKMG